jgi:hypothetical protein
LFLFEFDGKNQFLTLGTTISGYLIDQKYLRGDSVVDALGWAEDRTEELMLRWAN